MIDPQYIKNITGIEPNTPFPNRKVLLKNGIFKCNFHKITCAFYEIIN